MERRDFLKNAGLVIAGLASHNLFAAAKGQTPQSKADFSLRIAPVSFGIAPGKTIHTFGYNGQVPGPLLRMKEGVPVTVDVFNDTDHEEIVHWHGQMISAEADGSTEEGSPAVHPHGHQRYSFTPKPVPEATTGPATRSRSMIHLIIRFHRPDLKPITGCLLSNRSGF